MTVYKFLGPKDPESGVTHFVHDQKSASIGDTVSLTKAEHDFLSRRLQLIKAEEADSDTDERQQDEAETVEPRGVRVNLSDDNTNTTA